MFVQGCGAASEGLRWRLPMTSSGTFKEKALWKGGNGASGKVENNFGRLDAVRPFLRHPDLR